MRWSATAWIEPHAISRTTGCPGGSCAGPGAPVRLAEGPPKHECEMAPRGCAGAPESGRSAAIGVGVFAWTRIDPSGEQGNKLPRTWDGRESYGVVCLREGSPAEWAELLRDYAEARKGGMSITASDADLVRAAIQLLAAEYCCAAEVEFEQAWSLVHGAYEKASL